MDNIYSRVLDTLTAYLLINQDVITEEEIKDLNEQIETIKEDAEQNEEFLIDL